MARLRAMPINARIDVDSQPAQRWGMTRRIAVLTAFALAAFVSTTGVAGAERAGGKVTGGGTVTALEVPLTPFHFTVNARSDSDGPSGRVTFRNADIGFVGDVNCYVQNGDTVELAGTVVKSNDLDGGFYALTIQDGGDADLIAFNASADTPLACGQAGAPTAPVENGNVTVHQATAE